MLLTYLTLILGFLFLIVAADYLVKGSASIAKRLKISNLIIGLTIVSMGTSAPELSVNILASLKGQAGMAIGNVVGSNIFNFLLIIGITALFRPISIKRSLIKMEIPFALLSSIILLLITADHYLDGSPGLISRSEGITLILLLALFLYSLYLSSRRDKGESFHESESESEIKSFSIFLSIVMVVGGVIGLMWGGRLIVSSATTIAKNWGLSETVIGITVVAVGTSLPELATSLVAAFRGNSDIAIGNVVGSTIFNILFILGCSSIIRPLPFPNETMIDVIVSVVATLLVLLLAAKGRVKRVGRVEGGILLFLYFIYIAFLLYR